MSKKPRKKTELHGRGGKLSHAEAEKRRRRRRRTKKGPLAGIPWQASNQDSTLSLLGAWVQSLVQELRSRKLCGMAKK